MSSSDHPQTDGQTEVTNRTVEQYLRTFCHHKPSLWYRFLPWAEFHYNTSYHTAAGLTPYQVVYGKSPPSIPSYLLGSSEIAASDELLSSREEILEILKKNLTKAQARMKLLADAKRREVNYEVGSWVHVKLQPYRQTSLSGEKYNKLRKRFYGPFRILERIGPVAYKLELPSNAKVHNVFHCSLLKPYCGDVPPPIEGLPADAVGNNPIISPLAVLASRTVSADGLRKQQVLVQWTGLPPEETSWEDWNDLQEVYNLEDKVDLDGVGNVMNTSEGADNNSAGPSHQPTTARPKRNIKLPSKYQNHVVYK